MSDLDKSAMAELGASVAHEEDLTREEDKTQAKLAAEEQQQETLWDAVRSHPQAVMWSVLLSTSIIMEGYDIVLIQSFFAQPSFSKKYGQIDDKSGTYQVNAAWQAGINNAVGVGTINGAFANGYFTHHFGYRKVLLASLTLISTFILISFFAPRLPVLLIGQFLCGIPWGVFATMAPAYASEVCPMALRGHLTVYVNLCWALGQLISAGVQAGFSGVDSEWSYRIPFAIQWIWPLPLFVILFFAPESPWHHVRRGELEQAERSIVRLSNKSQASLSKQKLAQMVHTNELEKSIESNTSYLQCFKGIDLRRTEIACMAFAAQPFCGSAMGGSPTYFFVQAGLSTSISFRMSVGGLGLAAAGTIGAWFLMMFLGRRTMYLWGLGSLALILMGVGITSAAGDDSEASNFAQAGLMIVWLLVYYTTVGPICYAIIGEVSSTRLRNKSICLARIVCYVAQIISNVTNPFMLNPTAAGLKGKTALVWGGCTILFFVWTYFRLPETKGRSFEELDLLFAKRVGARKFKDHQADPYADSGQDVVERKESQAIHK